MKKYIFIIITSFIITNIYAQIDQEEIRRRQKEKAYIGGNEDNSCLIWIIKKMDTIPIFYSSIDCNNKLVIINFFLEFNKSTITKDTLDLIGIDLSSIWLIDTITDKRTYFEIPPAGFTTNDTEILKHFLDKNTLNTLTEQVWRIVQSWVFIPDKLHQKNNCYREFTYLYYIEGYGS